MWQPIPGLIGEMKSTSCVVGELFASLESSARRGVLAVPAGAVP